MIAFVPPFQPADSFVNLIPDVLTRESATGAEAAVVAENATANGYGSVDIGAGETGVDADPLHTKSEGLPQIEVISVIFEPSGAPIRGCNLGIS